MLRRIAQALRVLLSLLGVALLVWLAVSWRYCAFVSLASPRAVAVFTSNGSVHVFFSNTWIDESSYAVGRSFDWGQGDEWIRPRVESTAGGAGGTIPIWLLAVMCLAWPVTSFLVRRRRRGFEVEAKDGGAVPDAAGGRG